MSWYLDIVCPGWEAIISDDYKYVMPLTVRKKLGQKYFYKPVFTQFLGIFSSEEIKEEIGQKFVNEVLKHVRFIDNWFNPGNLFSENKFYSKKQTQVLDLSNDYEMIAANYSRSSKNNVKKVRKLELFVQKEYNSEILIPLLKGMYYRKNVEGVVGQDFKNLNEIMLYAQSNNMGEYYTIYSGDKVCSAAFFLNWNGRSIIYHAANELGRQKRSMFFLIDEYIKDHVGQDLLFDFAGSNIPGVAEWNFGFGAENVNFYEVRINNLPIPIRWIKK